MFGIWSIDSSVTILYFHVIQKSELSAAQEARVATNGPSDSAVPDDELRRRLEMKDEEVKLYKDKYEECNKQLLQAVCSYSDF